MTEHDLHDPLRWLSETAPAPAPGLAGVVVERGRTARRRRFGAVAVAGAAAVAALVVLVPVLGSGSTDQGAETPAATDPTSTTEPPPPPEPSARMQVVAAGMRELLRENYPSEARLWVRDSVCERWSDPGPHCTNFTSAEMADLKRLLPTYSITWVGNESPRLPYVEISDLEDMSVDGGSVFVLAVHGPRDCAGLGYDVTLRPDSPPVVRTPKRVVSAIC